MTRLQLDFNVYPLKSTLLTYLTTKIEGLYSPNYDALIDALTFYDSPLIIELMNLDCFENETELLEVFDIIQKENKNIRFIKIN